MPRLARRMPPVQHVALDELVRGVQQDLRARQAGRERRPARPRPAAGRGSRTRRPTGRTPVRPHMPAARGSGRRASRSPSGRAPGDGVSTCTRAEQSRARTRARSSSARVDGARRAVARDQRARPRRASVASPSRNAHSTRRARRELDARTCEREARIEAGAGAAVERRAAASAAGARGRAAARRGTRRGRRVAVHAARRRRDGRGERDAVGELAGQRGCARAARPTSASTLGDDEARGLRRQCAEHQPLVGEQRQPARRAPPCCVRRSADDLHRIVGAARTASISCSSSWLACRQRV